MDFNDLKVDFGGFHHVKSIYNTFKAIGSTFNPLPVENSNIWRRGACIGWCILPVMGTS